jgi:hypothetical protein
MKYYKMEELKKMAEDILQPLLTKYNIPPGDVAFKHTILSLVMETLGNPAKELDSIFEGTLNGYEEVEKELPGMFKDQYLVTLELLRYFRAQKKA